MELNKMKTLHSLLKEFKNDYCDDYIVDKKYNGIMLELDKCIKLEEYKSMVGLMSEWRDHHRMGHISDEGFAEMEFILTFYHKTIKIGNSGPVFDAIYRMLRNEIEELERDF